MDADGWEEGHLWLRGTACHVPVPQEKLRSLVYSQHPDLRWPELLWRPLWADTRATQHGWSSSAIMLKAHFKLF